jgi:hypothetical protein
MAKAYNGIVGVVLLLLGIAGFFMKGIMGMQFFPAHNIIHLASGVVLLIGAAAGAKARYFALLFGVVYTLVAVLGFMHIQDLGSIKLGLNMTYSVVHLAVGLVGILAGMMTHAEGKAKSAAA